MGLIKLNQTEENQGVLKSFLSGQTKPHENFQNNSL